MEWSEPFEGFRGIFFARVRQTDTLKRADRVLDIQWDRGEQRFVLFLDCDHTQILCLETLKFFVDFYRNWCKFFLLFVIIFCDFLFEDVSFFQMANQSLDSLVKDVLVQFSFDWIYIFQNHVSPLKKGKRSCHPAVSNVLLEQLFPGFFGDIFQKLDYLAVLLLFVLLVVLELQHLTLILPSDHQNVKLGSISV